MQPIWVLVNCNSKEEAKKIGDSILKQRFGSCYDIFPREFTKYFWPPKTGETETAGGALLIIETLEEKYSSLQLAIKKVHSDELPFIAYLEIKGTEKAYNEWVKTETGPTSQPSDTKHS